mgnify:CR=1 FL=1
MRNSLVVIISLVSISFCLSAYAFAQQKPLVASCESGQGCVFQMSDITYEEADVLLDGNGKYANMSQDDMIVFAKVDGKWETFIEGKRSRSELDQLFGGDGYTMIYPFNPNVQPLDGQWKVDVGNVSGTACFVDVNAILNKGLSGMSQGGTVDFPEPFQARFLMNNPNVKWRMLTPNQYRGTMDFAAGPSSPMNMTFDVTIVNEQKMVGQFTIAIKVPTQDPCVSAVPITYTCIKPAIGQRDRRHQIDPFAEKKKFNIDRIPEEKKTQIDRIPDEKKTQIDRIPDEEKTKIERIPDENKTQIDRIPDEKKTKVDRIK